MIRSSWGLAAALAAPADGKARTPLNPPDLFDLADVGQPAFRPEGGVKAHAPGALYDSAARPSHAAAKAEAVLAGFARYDGTTKPDGEMTR